MDTSYSLFMTDGNGRWFMVKHAKTSPILPSAWSVCLHSCDHNQTVENQIRECMKVDLGIIFSGQLELVGRVEYKTGKHLGQREINHVYKSVVIPREIDALINLNPLMIQQCAWWTNVEIGERLQSKYISPYFRAIWRVMSSLRSDGPIVNLGDPVSADALPTSDHVIEAPFQYIKSLGGKGVRGRLVRLIQPRFSLSDNDTNLLATIVEDLHNVSLVVDDIEDQSTMRRGAKCAHLLFGTAQSINAYGFVMVRTIARLAERSPEAAVVLLNALVVLHRGQGTDIQWTGTSHVPSVDAYLRMIKSKTGALLSIIPKIASILGTPSESLCRQLVEWFETLGIYYQIRDDYCNACDPMYWESKGFFEDMNEGKLSYMVLLALRDNGVRPRLLELLAEEATPISMCDKQEAFWLLYKSGALEQTRQYLLRLYDELLPLDGVLIKSLYIPAIPLQTGKIERRTFEVTNF